MRKQPIDFRKEEVTYVTQRWLATESSSLVGVGSIGKSNLLQHLSDPDVHQHYLQKDISSFKAINIDPNMLGPIDTTSSNEAMRCWAGYELLMHRLYLAFYPFDMLNDDEALQFYETYQALQDGTNPLYAYMGLRYFELGLQFFLRKGIHIAFMFDEFEELLLQMPIKFFLTLRGLRDANKSQLSYLTFTRAPLMVLLERFEIDVIHIEPFIELFTDNIYYVGPYNGTDARDMITRLSKRNPKINLNDAMVELLMHITGRYAGLLRATFRKLDTLGQISQRDVHNPAIVQSLIQRNSIREECHTIWQSLTSAEQFVLKAVARLSSYEANDETDVAVGMLVQKRLLQVEPDQQKLDISPPLFREYVASDPAIL